jgi:hypothetical protein
VASNARLDSHEKMRLCTNPLSWSYAEYLLRVGNGQESSIIDHFPPKADAEPLVGVDINLYSEIHQAPSFDTLIHVVLGLGNQLRKPRIHGRSNYSYNKKYSCEFSQHSNCQGCARARAPIFVSRLGGNEGRLGYGDWHKISQHRYFGRYATTSLGPPSWDPYYLIEKSQCNLGIL